VPEVRVLEKAKRLYGLPAHRHGVFEPKPEKLFTPLHAQQD